VVKNKKDEFAGRWSRIRARIERLASFAPAVEKLDSLKDGAQLYKIGLEMFLPSEPQPTASDGRAPDIRAWPDHPQGLPPYPRLDWSRIEAIAEPRDLPDCFRDEVERRVWEILIESWRTKDSLRKEVDQCWRKLMRRAPYLKNLIRLTTQLRGRGRPDSLALFDDLICWLDMVAFGDLENKTNPNRTGKSAKADKEWHQPFKGRFSELVYEIIRQMKPILQQATNPLVGVDVFRQDQPADERQIELNYIGRRIKKVRDENVKKRRAFPPEFFTQQ
jgi:hypothetical protein